MKPTAPGLYVHVPFCTVRCSYCDFHVAGYRAAVAERYVDALLEELAALEGEGFRPRTIFIGGGTPSVLPPDAWGRLLRFLGRAFGGDDLEEWTVEANPGTIDREKAEIAREAGVDRISTGAQTFSAEGLQVLGREHGPEVVAGAHALLREAGFERLSLDLIIGWPGQTAAAVDEDLRRVREIDPGHVSLYHLSYEEGTALDRQRRAGRVEPLPDPEVITLARRALSGLREAGYARYEVSNLCRSGEESLHNLNYWLRGGYRGVGSGAANFAGGARWRNLADVGGYIRAGGRPERVDVEEIGAVGALEERLFLSLRLERGLDIAEFEERAGASLSAICGDAIDELVGDGLLVRGTDSLRATERGFEVLDAVILKLWDGCDWEEARIDGDTGPDDASPAGASPRLDR
ncbi:MAG: radical SAM family heme chaperone HemW [Planctomycetota bacterium]